MKNSQGASQLNNNPFPINRVPQRNLSSIQGKQNAFSFIQSEENPSRPPSSFSQNGLSQDLIKVTEAEPDIPLEVSHALFHVLWPQIEKLSNVSLKDAWKRFLGDSILKGIFWSPEKLVGHPQEVKAGFSRNNGERHVFRHLDEVVESILNLKSMLAHQAGEISQKENIMASLELVQGFYRDFRNKVKGLVERIIEKETMDKNPMSEYHALENLLEPKAVMTSDIFAGHWAYRISRKKAQKALSLDNWKNPINGDSMNRIAILPEKNEGYEPLVYFKANGATAIQPEKEFMLYSLYRQLQIPAPETALLILTNVFGDDPNYYYAVQASEAVPGESALEACKNQETVFEDKTFIEQAIGTLLTNPSECSLKKCKYSSHYKTLVSVDNTLAFKPEFMGEIVNVKSILYLLPQMDLSIPESVKTFFTSLDLHLTTFSWLQSLSQKNAHYKILFTRLAFQKTRLTYQSLRLQDKTPLLEACLQEKIHVDPEFHGDSFYPQILVSKGFLSSVKEKLQIIGKILKKNQFISTQILFEEISPVLGKYYRKLRLEFNDIEKAEKALWGKEINGVNYSEVKSLLSPEEFEGLSENKNVTDENQIPEMFFNEYKNQLVSGECPLDQFIKRHNQRIKRNSLNLREVLEDLQLLIQEGLTNSQLPRDILDFLNIISKMIGSDQSLIKEITFLLSNLPNAELKWLLTLEKYFLPKNDPSVKSSSVAVAGVFLKEKVFNLSESEYRYLFDRQGDILKRPLLTGRLPVTYFPEQNPNFYLKQYPEFPGYEFASTLFMRLLGIKHIPYHDLLIIKNSYPVLITQNVRGNPVHKIWNNSQAFDKLDPAHTVLLIIAAMLINPEDGKEDNFILSEDGKYLIPIDNDHYFLPSTFQKKGDFWNLFTVNTALQTKTLLFSLKEMKRPIPVEVKEHIKSIDFDSLLKEWLIELDKVQGEYNNLINEDQQRRFSEHGTITNILFYGQFINQMHWKAHKIKHILASANKTTPLDLLKVIEPFVAKCYESSFEKGSDLQSRFKTATDPLYTKPPINGCRASIQDTRYMMDIINIPEKDLQNDVLFQRMGTFGALERLNQLIQEHSEKTKERKNCCLSLTMKIKKQNGPVFLVSQK